jgi:hypothetical protein
MKPKLLIRLAAGCLLFFAFGHTMGHLTRKDVEDEKTKEVIKAMEGYRFDLFGALRTYDEMFTGMSLNLTLTLLTLVSLLWIISNGVDKNAAQSKNLVWPIALCVIGFAVTGFVYFFMVPAITCVAAAILLIWAALRL